MNIWHDMAEDKVKPNDFYAVIEISKGSKAKYELDKETGMLLLDRILHTSMQYPCNYGFIPRTYGDDKDPLDVLVLCSEDIQSMSLVRCYPIGVVMMVDGGENDEKIIAVPYSDPMYNNIKELEQLNKHVYEEMSHFFSTYKQLEGKTTKVESVKGRADAERIIQECMDKYKAKFGK